MDYPHYDKMLRMLRFLSRKEQEIREHFPEDTHLYLNFYHRERPACVEVQRTRQNVGDELGISGASALGLLRELAAGDYVDLVYGRDTGPSSNVGSVTVVFLPRGRAAIMEVPDPNAELARRLESIATAIEGLRDVDPAERRRAAAAARELKTFGRGLAPEAAVELAKQLPAIFGLGG